jgi:hypothetical protein
VAVGYIPVVLLGEDGDSLGLLAERLDRVPSVMIAPISRPAVAMAVIQPGTSVA